MRKTKGKPKATPARLEQLAMEEAVRVFYAQRGYHVSSVQMTPMGAVARFPKGGPNGLRKIPLSHGSLQAIVDHLSNMKGDKHGR